MLQTSGFRQKLNHKFADLAEAFDTIKEVFGAGLCASDVDGCASKRQADNSNGVEKIFRHSGFVKEL